MTTTTSPTLTTSSSSTTSPLPTIVASPTTPTTPTTFHGLRRMVRPHRRKTPGALPPQSQSRWLVPLLLGLFSVVLALLSDGYLEPFDEVAHYLFARQGWSDPRALLSIWGRIGATGLYGLVAPWGMLATRLMAVGVTLCVAAGMTVVLRHFLRRSGAERRNSWIARHGVALAWLLLFGQPFFVLESIQPMTEMLLAGVWIWTAAVLVLRRRTTGRGILLAGLILGLGGLVRPEAWVALACWPGFAWVWLARPVKGVEPMPVGQRIELIVASTFAAALPTAAWYAYGVFIFYQWDWFMHWWPWPAESQFGRSGLIFLASSAAAMGVWMWLPIVAGIVPFLRRGRRRKLGGGWRREGLLLLVLPFVGLFALHGVLGSLGLFGSLSLPRYFISVAPLGAILALFGLIRWERRAGGGRVVLARSAAVVLPVAMLGALIVSGHLPAKENLTYRRLDLAVEAVRGRLRPEQYATRVIAGNPYVLMQLRQPIDGPADVRTMKPVQIRYAVRGTVLVYDEFLWRSEGRATPEQLEKWGYVPDDALAARTDALAPTMPTIRLEYETARVRLWVKKK